ncbi:MAG: penicillin-binding protein activator [Candidatus Binatia bacterium]
MRGIVVRGFLAFVLLLGRVAAAEESTSAVAPKSRLWADPPATPASQYRHPGQLQPPVVGRPAVGVLLPLSGRYRAFGDSCLKGIRVALGAIEGQSPLVRTVVLDSAGEAAQAAAGFQKLAADPSIVAVLGPMVSAEVDAVRPYVQASGLATMNFSQRPVGGALFRFSLTKEDQARALASYAVGRLGLRRWAILHPDDAYGRDISLLFRQAVERFGGRVLADVGYETSKADLQAEARRLQARLGITENQPLPIDGVFLPDSAERLAMVTSYLTFVDIRGIQLLGAAGWDRPQALLSAMPAVNGGVFVDGFFLYSFQPEVRSFVDAFRDAYQTDPGALEAYGYDAAALLRDIITAGTPTRAGVLTELYRPGSHRGATGETVITADGRIEKSLFLLKVEEGAIHELEVPTTARSRGSFAPGGAKTRPWLQSPDWDSRSMEDRIGGGR